LGCSLQQYYELFQQAHKGIMLLTKIIWLQAQVDNLLQTVSQSRQPHPIVLLELHLKPARLRMMLGAQGWGIRY
jgi:RNase adaptor protein for sRNA GlmZ degradation